MADTVQFGLLALIVGSGLIGGFLIARFLRGGRALAAWLLWLAVPFVLVALILIAERDPTLSQERASYNFSFGLVLISLIVAVPWLPANLVGGLAGLVFRGPRPDLRGWTRQAPGVGLPHWERADDPLLSLAELAVRMQEAAARIGANPRSLPHLGPIVGDDGAYIDRQEAGYLYAELERGQFVSQRRSVNADELLHRVFVDQAFILAGNRLAAGPRRFPDHEYGDRLAAEMRAILDRLDPAWGNQFALERAK